MATDRTSRLKASPPLFGNRFLDFFSRIHPSIPAILYLPVIAALIVLATRDAMGAGWIVVAFVAGFAFWTLTEYWLHRKLFHWQPDNTWGRRMHFVIHGVHHDHPNDRLRLVMPPGASIPLAILFFAAFYLVLGTPNALPAFAGFLLGYLVYDYTHYYLHHRVPRTDLGKRLRAQHMRHHFQDHRFGFGVSSTLWDRVFRTLPPERRSD